MHAPVHSEKTLKTEPQWALQLNASLEHVMVLGRTPSVNF